MKSATSFQRIDELLATLCTHCGRQWMKPSAPRGFVEWLAAKFWLHRFRCRACLRRSFRFCPPWNETLNEELRRASHQASRRAAALEAAAISALMAGAENASSASGEPNALAERAISPQPDRTRGKSAFKQAA